MVFTGNSVNFLAGEKIVTKMNDIWFIYLQRISKRLKTCDAIFFDGQNIIEFTTDQTNIEKITDTSICPVYFGGFDPLPWKKMMREADKHKWHREDWQHFFEDSDSDSDSDSDADWKPESDDEPSDDETDEEDDEPPAKKLCQRPSKQTSHDSKSE